MGVRPRCGTNKTSADQVRQGYVQKGIQKQQVMVIVLATRELYYSGSSLLSTMVLRISAASDKIVCPHLEMRAEA